MTLSANGQSCQPTWYLVSEPDDQNQVRRENSDMQLARNDTKFFVTTITTLPQRPQNFLLVKYSLIGIILVNFIQTIIFVPLLGDVLKEVATISPYFSEASDRLVISLAVLSVLLTLATLTTGLIGTMLENFYLLMVFAILMMTSVILCSLPHVKHKMVLLSMISDLIVVGLSLIFASMCRKIASRDNSSETTSTPA